LECLCSKEDLEDYPEIDIYSGGLMFKLKPIGKFIYKSIIRLYANNR